MKFDVDESHLQWERKIWGYVSHIFQSDHLGLSLLRVIEGFQCSQHWHNDRDNTFIVLSGKIVVEERQMAWDRSDLSSLVLGPVRRIVLCPGEIHTVPVGNLHRFQVINTGVVVEVYRPTPTKTDAVVMANDIVRLDVGGPINAGS